MVKTYSKAKDGGTQLSANFKVSEFACKDGSDKILIDDVLVKAVQHIRGALGKSITITSAYRTPEHNKKCGGATNSQHLLGTAADLIISGVDTLTICKAAENALKAFGIAGGIGLYTAQNFVHVDVRASKSRWQNDGKGDYSVNGWAETAAASSGTSADGAAGASRPTVRLGGNNPAADVKYLQTRLNAVMGLSLAADGSFGAKTEAAVKNFQTARKLTADGIVGAKTWSVLG